MGFVEEHQNRDLMVDGFARKSNEKAGAGWALPPAMRQLNITDIIRTLAFRGRNGLGRGNLLLPASLAICLRTHLRNARTTLVWLARGIMLEEPLQIRGPQHGKAPAVSEVGS